MFQRLRNHGRRVLLYGGLMAALLMAVMIHWASRDEQLQTVPRFLIGAPVMLEWTPTPVPVPGVILPDERYLQQPPGKPFQFNGQTYYFVPLG